MNNGPGKYQEQKRAIGELFYQQSHRRPVHTGRRLRGGTVRRVGHRLPGRENPGPVYRAGAGVRAALLGDTALTGPIGLVRLMARIFCGADLKIQIPVSAMDGALLLILADAMGMTQTQIDRLEWLGVSNVRIFLISILKMHAR